MKTARLLGIYLYLLNHDKVTAATLAHQFDVSVRTIVRDMLTLDEAGIPIVSYQGYEGGYGLIEGYKLNQQVMHDEEMQWTLSAVKGLHQALGDRTLYNLIQKFEAIGHEYSGVDTLSINLLPWGVGRQEKDKITRLHQAIQTQHLISINYVDRSGNISQRTIEPLQLVLKGSTWYVYGYCHRREDFRLFKLLRIQSADILDTCYTSRPFDSNVLNEDFSTATVHLKWVFPVSERPYVYDLFSIDAVTETKDNQLIVDVDYPEDSWLYSFILGIGNRGELIEPLHLRTYLLNESQKMLQLYGGKEKDLLH